jgi:hypothetical protein
MSLKNECEQVQQLYVGNCSGAVKAIAKDWGCPLPEKDANGLIDFFNTASSGWRAVSADDAQKLADMEWLVIAGKKDSPNGHVVAVMPGGQKASGGYSYTTDGKKATAANHGNYPRACSTAMGSWPGAVSNGEKTVFDAWGGVENYRGVKYWAAPVVGSIEDQPRAKDILANLENSRGASDDRANICGVLLGKDRNAIVQEVLRHDFSVRGFDGLVFMRHTGQRVSLIRHDYPNNRQLHLVFYDDPEGLQVAAHMEADELADPIGHILMVLTGQSADYRGGKAELLAMIPAWDVAFSPRTA